MQSIDSCSSDDRTCEHYQSQRDRSVHGVHDLVALVVEEPRPHCFRGQEAAGARDSDAITVPTIPAMNYFCYELARGADAGRAHYAALFHHRLHFS
jgi:hypothetical protein